MYNLSSYKILFPSSNGPLVIAVKLEDKCKFLATAMLLFNTLQKLSLKCSIFFENLLIYVISVYKVSVPPITQFRASTMLLLIIGNYKVRRWGDFQWLSVHTEIRENRGTGSVVEKRIHTQTA
jgi:hypothetical protein